MKTKKILAMLLSFVMILAFAAVPAFAGDEQGTAITLESFTIKTVANSSNSEYKYLEITQSGSYYLGDNFEQAFIHIKAEDVVLDLNGKTLSGNNPTISQLNKSPITVEYNPGNDEYVDFIFTVESKDPIKGSLTIIDSVGGGKVETAGNGASIYTIDIQKGAKCTIKGGTFENNCEGNSGGTLLSSFGTLNIEGGTFLAKKASPYYIFDSVFAKQMNDASDPSYEYPPYEYQIAPATYGVTTITGGIFDRDISKYKLDEYELNCVPEGYECVADTPSEGLWTVQKVETAANVAKIDTTEYATLADAIAAVPTNGTKTTVTLLSDITAESKNDYVTIDGGRNVELDMNGHTIAISSYDCGPFTVDGGTLELSGKGTVKNTYTAGDGGFWVVRMKSAPESQENYSVFTQGKDVELIGVDKVVYVTKINDHDNYGTVVNLNGKCSAINTDGESVVYVHGNVNNTVNAPIINFGATAEIKNKNYIAGYAIVNVADGATFTTTNNCFNIAAGEININGGSFTGGDIVNEVLGSGGAIDYKTGCAVYVKQHSTNLPLTANIKGGTFKSAIPFCQEKGKADTPKPEDITFNISGGEFFSTATNPTAVKSEDKTGFITGGYFANVVEEKYIADGYECIVNTDSNSNVYGYKVAKKAAKPEIVIDEEKIADADIKTEGEAAISGETKEAIVESIKNNDAVNTFANTGIAAAVTADKTDIIAALKNKASVEAATKIDTSTALDSKINVNLTSAVVKDETTFTAKEMTFNVTPVVTTTVTKEDGETETVSVELSGKLEKPLTFRLPVVGAVNVGEIAEVYHIDEGKNEKLIGRKTVEADNNGNKFVEVTNNEFSPYLLKFTGNKTVWQYGFDSAVYQSGDIKKGVVRFLFDSGVESDYVDYSKVLFYSKEVTAGEAKEDTSPKYGIDTEGGKGYPVFSADLYNLDPENKTTLYAVGCIKIGDNDYIWSNVVPYNPTFAKEVDGTAYTTNN